MTIRPVKGMIFVIEDIMDDMKGMNSLKEMGFVSVEERATGVTGVVLVAAENEHGIKEGDHIIFSKFVSEQVELKDKDGKIIENLRSIPADCVSAFLDED